MRVQRLAIMIGIVGLLIAVAVIALSASPTATHATPTQTVGIPGAGSAVQFCRVGPHDFATPATDKTAPNVQNILATACAR